MCESAVGLTHASAMPPPLLPPLAASTCRLPACHLYLPSEATRMAAWKLQRKHSTF